MEIVVLAPSDKRNRFEFMYLPLVELGHEVVVVRSIGALLTRAIFRRVKPDIVMSVGVGSLSTIARYLFSRRAIKIARFGGDPISVIPVFLNSHVVGVFEKIKLRCKYFLRLNDIASYGKIIVVSESLGHQLRKYLPVEHHIYVIPQYCRFPVNLKDTSVFKGRVLNILCVTNLQYSEKAEGVLHLVSVMQKLAGLEVVKSKYDVVKFSIAGGGRYLDEISADILDRDLPGFLKIEVLGYVPNVNVLYDEASVFVYSSERDAVPNVLLEAKSKGLPVVAFRSESTDYLINHSIDGYLVDSVDEAVEKLEHLCCDSRLMANMGLAAQRDIAERFSFESVTKEVGIMVDSLVDRN